MEATSQRTENPAPELTDGRDVQAVQPQHVGAQAVKQQRPPQTVKQWRPLGTQAVTQQRPPQTVKQ